MERRIAGQLVRDLNAKTVLQGNGMCDCSSIHVYNPDFLIPLRYSDEEVVNMCSPWSKQTAQVVPGVRYWQIDERRKMSLSDNCCGDQQRAFDFYWAIRCGTQEGRIGLAIGATTANSPATLGTDKYHGTPPPSASRRYGDSYGYPMMHVDADVELPFFPNSFGFCLANHVIEHLECPQYTIKEMLRVVVPGGIVALITPDMSFMRRGVLDDTHIREFSADEFWHMLMEEDYSYPDFEVMCFNSLENDFSFEAVLRKL